MLDASRESNMARSAAHVKGHDAFCVSIVPQWCEKKLRFPPVTCSSTGGFSFAPTPELAYMTRVCARLRVCSPVCACRHAHPSKPGTPTGWWCLYFRVYRAPCACGLGRVRACVASPVPRVFLGGYPLDGRIGFGATNDLTLLCNTLKIAPCYKKITNALSPCLSPATT